MLRNPKEKRTITENLLLGSSTALVAGMINVAGVIAFLAFTTNITGHVAGLARHVSSRDFDEVLTVFGWLFLFFLGAFTAHFLIRSFEHKSRYRAHSVPILLEAGILLVIAIYGDHFYTAGDLERELIIGAILFCMGLQNSMVSVVSGGLIKTTHLTGLFTDLGADFSEWIHPNTPKSLRTTDRMVIRLTILGCYFAGAVSGGFLFEWIGFSLFYFFPLVLASILVYDLLPFYTHRLKKSLLKQVR